PADKPTPPAAEQSPRRPEGPRPGRPPRDRPPRAREPKAPVPQLNLDDFGTGRPRLRELDADIADELEAAMSGLEQKDLLAEPQRGKRPEVAGTEQARKKGRVLSVRGGDVFVDVPGGRSQGVLSMLQFPEGPPEVGSEVEVNIEGYDRANG